MLKGRKYDHIGLATKDITATANWYMDVLGFEVYGDFVAPDGTKCKFIRGEDIKYEVFEPVTGIDPLFEGKIDHIAYISDDIEADYEYCIKRGFKCTTDGIQTVETFWKRGCKYFKVESATREVVEFCQVL
jgi:catechol 2,3-dioxygenase-like lactoylglutathione lyase family enzyme